MDGSRSVTCGFTCFLKGLRRSRLPITSRSGSPPIVAGAAPPGRDPRLLASPRRWEGLARRCGVLAPSRGSWMYAISGRTRRWRSDRYEGPLLRAAQRFEHRLYRSAAAITVTTAPSARQIEARGGAGKVAVIPNGTTRDFLEAGDRSPTSGLLGDRTTGSVGPTQGTWAWSRDWSRRSSAARELGEGFQLVLIGDGRRRSHLRKACRGHAGRPG